VDFPDNGNINGFSATNFGYLMKTVVGAAILVGRENGLNFVRQLLFAAACCDPDYQKRFGLEMIRHKHGTNLPIKLQVMREEWMRRGIPVAPTEAAPSTPLVHQGMEQAHPTPQQRDGNAGNDQKSRQRQKRSWSDHGRQ
jgi:hypothetical protein